MNYRLKNNIPGTKMGQIVEPSLGKKGYIIRINEKEFITFPKSVVENSDWFEPIDEHSEEIEKAKELLIDHGYSIFKEQNRCSRKSIVYSTYSTVYP